MHEFPYGDGVTLPSSLAIVDTDIDGRILKVTAAARRLLGYGTRGPMRGVVWRFLVTNRPERTDVSLVSSLGIPHEFVAHLRPVDRKEIPVRVRIEQGEDPATLSVRWLFSPLTVADAPPATPPPDHCEVVVWRDGACRCELWMVERAARLRVFSPAGLRYEEPAVRGIAYRRAVELRGIFGPRPGRSLPAAARI